MTKNAIMLNLLAGAVGLGLVLTGVAIDDNGLSRAQLLIGALLLGLSEPLGAINELRHRSRPDTASPPEPAAANDRRSPEFEDAQGPES